MAKSGLSHESWWADEQHCKEFKIIAQSKKVQEALAEYASLFLKVEQEELKEG